LTMVTSPITSSQGVTELDLTSLTKHAHDCEQT